MLNPLYNYWPIIRRPPIKWPDGARLAFWVGINVEHYEVDLPGTTSIFGTTAQFTPDPLNFGWRDYSLRVGIWRLMEVLDRYAVRGSVLLNSDVCEYYPEVVEEGNKRGWAWLAHGKNNSIFEANMDPGVERAYLKDVVSQIRRVTGKQPKGWLGPALTETFETADLLADLGLNYVCDWCCDDQPFPVHTRSGRMVSVPYSIEINDISLFVGKSLSGPDFLQIVTDQFDMLYEQSATTGLVMCLAVHPFVIGQPFRLKYLDKLLRHVASRRDVWLTTGDEIADWYIEHHYDEAAAQLRARAREDRR